jgi:putative transposase
MTYHTDCTLPNGILKQIAEQGFEFLPELIRILVNAAMQAERQKYLAVGPYERSDNRQGHANGYKPKTVHTRVWESFKVNPKEPMEPCTSSSR